MNSARTLTVLSRPLHWGTAVLVAVAISVTAGSAAHAQKLYKTPDDAVAALVAAARSGDVKDFRAVLGPSSRELVSSGDKVQDEETRQKFLSAYDTKHGIAAGSYKQSILTIGADDWPFPIPMVEEGSQWKFDVAAGREEILARRVGRNEQSAIKASLAYVDAQNDYADMNKNSDGMAIYARKIISSPGKKDGLYWPAEQGQPESPLGEAVAAATTEGYRVDGGQQPFHGYFYKVLTRQGPEAPGGALDYVVKDNMIGGFALVAWPAEYGNSGIMTFLVGHDGVVFQKDLGPRTEQIARRMTAYNPDHTWSKSADDK